MSIQFCALVYIIVCCACIIDLSYSTWRGGRVLANGVVARKPLTSDAQQEVQANFIVAALSR